MEVQKEKKKCQFYIVLGSHDREFKNSKYYQYFPVGECKGDKESIAFILKGLGRAFEKKKNLKQPVEDHLIFLIPDASYFDQARGLMKKLDPSGRIQIVPPLKKKETKIVKTEIKEEESVSVKKEVPPIKKEENTTSVVKPEIKEEKQEPVKVVKQPAVDNIYHGEISKKETANTPKKEENVMDYMWGDTKNKKLENKTKKKEKISSPKKEKKKIDIPVIIFILSAILLVTSIILLFVLK